MSKPVNATAIGGFLLGGLALLITALLVFGGGDFFKPKLRWVVYFDTSLNGLNVGAPVKVQGVQVGIVKKIVLQLDQESKRLWKPVELEIDPERLAAPDGGPIKVALTSGERKRNVDKLIDAGLRARLELQSILTGLLYVDLDFRPQQIPPNLTGLNYNDMPEIPSVPPTVDEVKNNLEDIVQKIRNIPLDAMVADVAATLADIRRLVGSKEARQSQEALAKALADAQRILAGLDRQLPPVLGNLDKTMANLSQASREVGGAAKEASTVLREVNGKTAPVMKAAEQALLKATEALDSARGAAANVADATSSESSLQEAVVELRNAAQSMRQLTDYLERHPDSVIFGKPD